MKATEKPSFGALLRRHRHAVGLTQEELAERAELSVRQLAYLEQDRHVARPGTVRRLADALRLSEDEHAALLAAGQATDGAARERVRSTLPVQPTPFIGRGREVAAIADLLRHEHVRLLTLTGPGGTGKTRLAVQAAQHLLDAFPDGIVFVPLASITDPSLVASTVAAALAVKEVPGEPLVEALQQCLRQQRLLLLLDNFEHLLPAATLVSELLAVCPQLAVLATSRAVLHLAAEHVYAVPPLAVPDPRTLPSLGTLIQYDAVALFIERARAAKASFSLTVENAPAVIEICRRLDGLPLAIELAAARTRLFPPHTLLARLESRLQVLTGGTRDVPARQQTLRSTIDWSYSLLSNDEQMLFRRLAMFVGGCTLEAAEAVCGDGSDRGGEVLERLESLVDQSLLVMDEQGGEPRFHMLETLQEYALEQLAASAETDEIRRRHAAAFLHLAEDAERESAATEHIVWAARLQRENDNLRRALAWSLERDSTGEAALRLAGALAWFWSERWYLSEGRRWLEQSLALSTSSHVVERCPRAWANVATGIGELASRQGDFATARTYTEQGVAIWRTLNDTFGLLHALRVLGHVVQRQGDHALARALLEERVELSRGQGNSEAIHALYSLAREETLQGDLRSARSLLEEAVSLAQQIGHTAGIVHTLCALAEVARSQADTVAQRGFYEQALANLSATTEPTDLFHELGKVAWSAMRLGAYEEAEKLLTERLSLARGQADAGENWWMVGWALNHLGDVARCQGQVDQAGSLYEESLRVFQQYAERQGIAAVLHNLGHVALFQGNTSRARSLFTESLSLFQELDLTWSIADCVTGLAGVAGQEGCPVQAAVLYGAADAAHHAIDASGMMLDPFNQMAWEQEMAAARGETDVRKWEEAWEIGRAMSLKEAVAYALGESTQAPAVLSLQVRSSVTDH